MLRTYTSNLMEKNDTKWTQQQEKSTPKNHTQHFRQTHVWTYYFEEHSCISQIKKIKLKSRIMKWDRENPYLFLDVWRRYDAKMEAFSKETWSVWERYFGEDNEQSLKLEGKLKNFEKLSLKMQNTRFSRLGWVANKSPGQAAKTLKVKIMKKNF